MEMCFGEIFIYFILSLFITCLIIHAVSDADLTLYIYHLICGPKDFQNKVVWITGASSGIGEHLAYSLARRNAKLVLSGTNTERLEQVKNHCLSISKCEDEDIMLLPFPIQNFGEHESCVNKVLDKFGRIDILVNNAGVSQRADFKDVDIEIDQNLFNINVFGPVNLSKCVLKHFYEQKQGHFVVTSSTAGKLGAPYSRTYTGSKHALQGYFECLRSETIHDNISVTLVCPGPVFSRLVEKCVTGKVGEKYDFAQGSSDKKMKTERCSELMATAISYKLDECWISPQPILFVMYLAQYMPSFFHNVLLKLFFSKERVMKYRQGR